MNILRKITATVTALSLMAACSVPVGNTVSAEEASLKKVICVGDSITYGSNSSNPATRSYPAQLQNLLDSDLYTVENYGVSGATALKNVSNQISYWSTDAYQNSMKSNPDIVIIMLGTNDVNDAKWDADKFREELTELVNGYRNLTTSPAVYLATPPTCWDSTRPTKLQAYAVPIVKEIAADTGVTMVDINAATADWEALFPDKLHPNDEGYYKMALLFYEKVFHLSLSTLTVTTKPGNIVSIGGQASAADETGKAVLQVGQGRKTLRLEEPGVGFAYTDVTVQGDTDVDLTELVILQNLALTATVLDCGRQVYGSSNVAENINDGDESTGWQVSGDGKDYTDMWIGYDFGKETTFNSLEIAWEDATRSSASQYSVSVSEDGVTYRPLSVEVESASFGDVVSFANVTSRYLRLTLTGGTNSKYYPQIYELRVFRTSETGLTGDVDGNGAVEAADLTVLARHVGGIETVTDQAALERADMNRDNNADAADLTALARRVGGIE